jgi:UDPglucose 6-dehydrogenase
VALSFFARAMGTEARIAEATEAVNRTLADRAVSKIRPLLTGGATVAVLGLSYKPHSSVIEESPGIHIAKAAAAAGARVIAFDPLAAELARAEMKHDVIVMDSLQDCLRQAEIVLITTPDPVFKKLAASDFPLREKPVVVVDYWRILTSGVAGAPHVKYVAVGRNADEAAAGARLASMWRLPESRER